MTTPARRGAPELTPAEAETVRATLPLIGANIDRITGTFYATLFEHHPALRRDLFNRGNQAQGSQQRALAASIATFAGYLVDPALPHPTELLARIGHKHASLGITPDQYQVVHDNLFAAIVAVLGADVVTPPVAAAWDTVYWMMADALIDLEKQLYVGAGVEPGDVFRRVTVTERADDAAGTAVFTVAAPDGADPLPNFLPGQYLSVGVRLPDGARQLRQYSLVNAPGGGVLEFAVKRVRATAGCPAGEVSNHLHDTVHAGDELEITLPFGDLTVDTDAATPLVLISAGIGSTPMVGVLEHLAARNPDRPVRVLHADRAPGTHPLRDRTRALVARLGAASLDLWYAEPTAGAHHGLLDLTGITFAPDAEFYLCGATGFLDAVRAQLAAAGVPARRIHLEQFTPTDWQALSCPV
ncbi:globin domain-containing protein [Nocardia neocaledoniensis]|uniref:globin domain-containing protein n=1 Tax=Nocardia neocaledoniensis TaxID=236511 RepID=UPI00245882BC|nr:globin domain-containing protein [Nocardia neocaledoniensis]